MESVASHDCSEHTGSLDDPVLQVVPLAVGPWPTVDPFLFCVHHLDFYPAGTEAMTPSASLDGRAIGQDFAGKDGWNMYHGSGVPGFPQHPHRGFETVTFVRRGYIDHSDSLGATARFGRGDVQWMTAGGGVQHCEMFPLLDTDGPNTLELFQIWLNLPRVDKMVEPYFTMLWGEDLPVLEHSDDQGRAVRVEVVAGRLAGLTPPAPPPNSWAARPEADLAIWHVTAEAGSHWTLPAASAPETVRTVYVFDGASVFLGGHEIPAGHGAVVRADVPVELVGGDDTTECLVLQGRPIGEPVAQYGPFVMNTREEIEAAFADYRATQFGGWPWDSPDPTHPRSMGRFARHADGRLEVRDSDAVG
ncbi:MAG: pirin family protein [Ilumatobacteraceae bacterium]